MARAEEEIQSEVTSSMVNELPTKVDEFLEVIKLQKNSGGVEGGRNCFLH